MTSIASPSSAYTGCTDAEFLSVTALANNRLSGYGYDSPGNLTSGSGVSGISYNAENQLITAAGVTYKYDGDGKRVQKSSGTLYWYGNSGDTLDETDLSGNLINEYVFFGGQRIARRDPSNNVFYYFADHLGTSRAIAEVPSGQSTATLCYDADFYPFGGERTAILNTCSQNYKFTGKERDTESGLDNFEARYDSSSLGRFMSADELGLGQHPENPQSWNLYAYVQNGPLNLTDPTGQYICDFKTVSQSQCDKFQKGLDVAQDAANKLREKYGPNSSKYTDAQRAIDAFGTKGIDNGVTIAQGTVGSDLTKTDPTGPAVAKTDDNPTGQNIRVTFDKNSHLLDASEDVRSLAALEAHEGSHVADASDWIGSGFDPNRDPTTFQTEHRAYNVTAGILEGLGATTMSLQDFKTGKTTFNSLLPLGTAGQQNLDRYIRQNYPNSNLKAWQQNTKGGH